MHAPGESEQERIYFGNQLGAVMNGRTVMMCLKCGALVAASEVHIRFHQELSVDR